MYSEIHQATLLEILTLPSHMQHRHHKVGFLERIAPLLNPKFKWTDGNEKAELEAVIDFLKFVHDTFKTERATYIIPEQIKCIFPNIEHPTLPYRPQPQSTPSFNRNKSLQIMGSKRNLSKSRSPSVDAHASTSR